VKFQIITTLSLLFIILVSALGYTIYSLKLRQHDYLILNHVSQLQLIASSLTERSKNYVLQAPDNYEKYYRDLETYWSSVQSETQLFDAILTALNSRELSIDLTGHHETIYCNYDQQSRRQVALTLDYWDTFKQDLFLKLGDDLDNPRLTWGAEYVVKNGPELVEQTRKLGVSFQLMMESRLNAIRLAQWISVYVGLFTLIVIFFVIQRGVIKPIDVTMKSFYKVAQGDLNHQVPIIANNEIGKMAISFNHLLNRINSLFKLTNTINQGTKLDEMLTFIHQEFQHLFLLIGLVCISPLRMAHEWC
jgi:HAMP domain-containing protein